MLGRVRVHACLAQTNQPSRSVTPVGVVWISSGAVLHMTFRSSTVERHMTCEVVQVYVEAPCTRFIVLTVRVYTAPPRMRGVRGGHSSPQSYEYHDRLPIICWSSLVLAMSVFDERVMNSRVESTCVHLWQLQLLYRLWLD